MNELMHKLFISVTVWRTVDFSAGENLHVYIKYSDENIWLKRPNTINILHWRKKKSHFVVCFNTKSNIKTAN